MNFIFCFYSYYVFLFVLGPREGQEAPCTGTKEERVREIGGRTGTRLVMEKLSASLHKHFIAYVFFQRKLYL